MIHLALTIASFVFLCWIGFGLFYGLVRSAKFFVDAYSTPRRRSNGSSEDATDSRFEKGVGLGQRPDYREVAERH
jgi:hypothetical protein